MHSIDQLGPLVARIVGKESCVFIFGGQQTRNIDGRTPQKLFVRAADRSANAELSSASRPTSSSM